MVYVSDFNSHVWITIRLKLGVLERIQLKLDPNLKLFFYKIEIHIQIDLTCGYGSKMVQYMGQNKKIKLATLTKICQK